MNENALVSILIPCYNHEAFLADCLTGIVQQTYANIELLICDDCSPDNSYQVIQQFAPALQERFSRVEILRNQTNCGVTKNINRMLNLAEGEYIKILASDDAMVPETIEKMVTYFTEHPDCDVVITNGMRVQEDQHYGSFVSDSLIYDETPNFSPEGFFERLARLNCIFAPGAMVRFSVFQTHGFYDETIPVEDMEYWLRLLKAGQVRFGYIPDALIFYRINSNSMSSLSGNADLEKRRRRMHNAMLDTLQKHKDGFRPGVFEEICLHYIFTERDFALYHKLTPWAIELRKQLHQFPGWNAVTLRKRLRLMLRMVKVDILELCNKQRTYSSVQ